MSAAITLPLTKVKHNNKARLTLSSATSASSHVPEARSHVQVLANSGVASFLILLHLASARKDCFANDPLVVGVLCNYAAVTADTFSSELGILSSTPPRLLTSPFRRVPPGTNGGVTTVGIVAGFSGAFIIALASMLLPFCPETPFSHKLRLVFFLTLWGGGGSLLDSLLGCLLQASVVDKRSGKIVEGRAGVKVPIHHPTAREHEKKDSSRAITAGRDWLDNNGVNLLMAIMMSVGGIILAPMLMRL